MSDVLKVVLSHPQHPEYGQIREEQGKFNDFGYIAYHGTMTLEELLREDPAERCQREQNQRIGGLS